MGKITEKDMDEDVSCMLNDMISPKYNQILNGIMEQREQILKAFIAETGLKPSECEQITQGNKWWIQKRE